jgi:hypothetical protein
MRRTIALLAALAVAACTAGPSSPAGPSSSPTAPSTEAPVETSTPTRSPKLGATPSVEPPASSAIWTPLSPSGPGPSAREDHTWTVDSAGGTAYLFGGRNGSRAHEDLWTFDLATDTWRDLAPDGPGPQARFGHEAVWVDGRGRVVFAGQASATEFFNDLWLFDPTANRWTQLPSGGATPVPRYGSCSAIGPDGRLWISHGFTEDGTRFADTRAYDFEAGTWSDVTPSGQLPVERCLHGCWFADDGRFVLYAGQTTGVEALADLWALSAPGSASAAWAQLDGSLPEDRNLYAFARHGGDVLVVGGRGRGSVFRADAWRFDGASLAASAVAVDGAAPPGRAGATLIDDPARGRMLLFGGKAAAGALADLWALSLP